ncbi:hypothetical protein PI124_g18334 [Phytophthora idaei]|nr:hypothetical protein PI125_g795 [Phytophthora idaei]KAG3136714.1 hypothetical protein PI126_g17692 [Phytophthora idaei]KAG3236662.1 hypothetical protein PI124_g18334 [Phytophthora idaei]
MDEDMNADFGDGLEEKVDDLMGVTPDTPEGVILPERRSGGTRSVSRILDDKQNDVAGLEPASDDYNNAEDSTTPVKVTQVTEPTTGKRLPVNGDTPAASQVVLGRCYEELKLSD